MVGVEKMFCGYGKFMSEPREVMGKVNGWQSLNLPSCNTGHIIGCLTCLGRAKIRA